MNKVSYQALCKQAGAVGDLFREYPILKTLLLGTGVGLGARALSKNHGSDHPNWWGAAGFALPAVLEYLTGTGAGGNFKNYQGFEGLRPQGWIDNYGRLKPHVAATKMLQPHSGVTADNFLDHPRVLNKGSIDWEGMAVSKSGPVGKARAQKHKELTDVISRAYRAQDAQNAARAAGYGDQ